MSRLDFSGNPYYLSEEQSRWVEETYASMTTEEKLGQVLCPAFSGVDEAHIMQYTQQLKVGGFMVRPLPGQAIHQILGAFQGASRIPLLISANLEEGGNGALEEGTYFAMPEGCAATGDVGFGYRLGKVACREAAAAGITWGYAPLVDIDNSYQNPITNVRSFGSDKNVVLEMARGYLRAAKEEGVAPTIKHFPGDGSDERDQHLLVSVNALSAQEWMDSYGMIYKTLIDEGAPSIMAGHIAQPGVARMVCPGISDKEAFAAGSQSKPLLTGLLREKFGFNGVIVTDSSLMVGYMQNMPRRQAVPYCIEAGCDMLLFNRNLQEDYEYLSEGYRNGILSDKRLEEAVLRILAMKAYLGLPEKQAAGKLVPDRDPLAVVNLEETKAWVEECADKAVTLVKDNQHILPMSPEKTKRVYLNVIEADVVNDSPFALEMKERLEKEGFEVELRKRYFVMDQASFLSGNPTPDMQRIMGEIQMKTEDFTSKYDCAMIIVNIPTVSNATTVRVNWKVAFGLGNDIPWYAGEMPLIVMSTANPYHLLDIPMADVYVNTYSSNKATLDAAFEKLMGRSEFKGVSPVDAFCGHEDCRVL